MFTCHEISEDQKGDQGGGPKMAKISGGVKPDIFKRAAQKWPNFGWGENSRFWGLLFGQKMLLTAEKSGVGPKLTKKIGWGKTRIPLKFPRSLYVYWDPPKPILGVQVG